MEKLIEYKKPKQFWDEVAIELKKNEAMNCLSLGLSSHFIENSENCLYQSALFYENKFIGSLIVSKFRTHSNLLISPIEKPEHVERLYSQLEKNNIPLTGFIGEKQTADLYKSLFEEKGFKVSTLMEQGTYRCHKVKMPLIPSSIKFRCAEEKDINLIAKWIELFHDEAVPHDPPIDRLEAARSRVKNGKIYLIEDNKKIVSMAAKGRDIKSSCAVNLVYTPAELRGNGYGSIVTAMLTQYLLEGGRKETNLFTDLSNSTSNKIYTSIGYEFVCESVHYGLIK